MQVFLQSGNNIIIDSGSKGKMVKARGNATTREQIDGKKAGLMYDHDKHVADRRTFFKTFRSFRLLSLNYEVLRSACLSIHRGLTEAAHYRLGDACW